MKGAKELAVIARNLQKTEKLILMEALAGGGNSGAFSEVLCKTKTAEQFSTPASELFKKIKNNLSIKSKHAGFLKNYISCNIKELKKGIVSFQKQIELHKAKISNPSKYIKNWDKLDIRQREALVKSKWPSDIKRLSEQQNILKIILKGKK